MLSISVQLSVNIPGCGLCNKKMFKGSKTCRSEKVKYGPNNGKSSDSSINVTNRYTHGIEKYL